MFTSRPPGWPSTMSGAAHGDCREDVEVGGDLPRRGRGRCGGGAGQRSSGSVATTTASARTAPASVVTAPGRDRSHGRVPRCTRPGPTRAASCSPIACMPPRRQSDRSRGRSCARAGRRSGWTWRGRARAGRRRGTGGGSAPARASPTPASRSASLGGAFGRRSSRLTGEYPARREKATSAAFSRGDADAARSTVPSAAVGRGGGSTTRCARPSIRITAPASNQPELERVRGRGRRPGDSRC